LAGLCVSVVPDGPSSRPDDDRLGTEPVVIINQAMARRYFPDRTPVGECLKIGRRSFAEDLAARDTTPCTTIVGVVGNTVRQDLTEGPVAQFYRPLDQVPDSVTDQSVSFFGYELAIRTRTRAWELGAKVLTAFGILALVLAAVGLYSVLAFSIAQRGHEFGVRMALGAQPADIIRLTLSVGLAPVIAGIAAGLVLALLGGKYVSSLLFEVAPRDPTVLGAVCAVLLGTGVLASLIPAIRATRVDPAAVLRWDRGRCPGHHLLRSIEGFRPSAGPKRRSADSEMNPRLCSVCESRFAKGAGDGTRTYEVQLGKRTENNEVVS
jgi:putative ABC transport system permease protein